MMWHGCVAEAVGVMPGWNAEQLPCFAMHVVDVRFLMFFRMRISCNISALSVKSE
jgi:hypothetical protein